MKLTRDSFAIYREGTIPQEFTGLPDPAVVELSKGDGTRTNRENWLDCIRSRAQPNSHVRAAVEAAHTWRIKPCGRVRRSVNRVQHELSVVIICLDIRYPWNSNCI